MVSVGRDANALSPSQRPATKERQWDMRPPVQTRKKAARGMRRACWEVERLNTLNKFPGNCTLDDGATRS